MSASDAINIQTYSAGHPQTALRGASVPARRAAEWYEARRFESGVCVIAQIPAKKRRELLYVLCIAK